MTTETFVEIANRCRQIGFMHGLEIAEKIFGTPIDKAQRDAALETYIKQHPVSILNMTLPPDEDR